MAVALWLLCDSSRHAVSAPALSIPLPPRLGHSQPKPRIGEAAPPSSPPKLGCPGTYRWSRTGWCARSAGSCARTATLPPGWRPGCCRTAPRPGSCCGSAGSETRVVRPSAGGNGPGRDLCLLQPLSADKASKPCSPCPKARGHTDPRSCLGTHPMAARTLEDCSSRGLLPMARTLLCQPPSPLPTELWATGNCFCQPLSALSLQGCDSCFAVVRCGWWQGE